MILQDSAAGCGAAAFCNALEALGNPQPQEVAWHLVGATGTRGTSPKGLIAGAVTLGHRAIILNQEDAGNALVALRGYLLHGVPVIMLVQDGAHWVCAVGTLGDKVLIADSADGGLISCLGADEVITRWRLSEGRRRYYGIAITNRKWP